LYSAAAGPATRQMVFVHTRFDHIGSQKRRDDPQPVQQEGLRSP